MATDKTACSSPISSFSQSASDEHPSCVLFFSFFCVDHSAHTTESTTHAVTTPILPPLPPSSVRALPPRKVRPRAPSPHAQNDHPPIPVCLRGGEWCDPRWWCIFFLYTTALLPWGEFCFFWNLGSLKCDTRPASTSPNPTPAHTSPPTQHTHTRTRSPTTHHPPPTTHHQ